MGGGGGRMMTISLTPLEMRVSKHLVALLRAVARQCHLDPHATGHPYRSSHSPGYDAPPLLRRGAGIPKPSATADESVGTPHSVACSPWQGRLNASELTTRAPVPTIAATLIPLVPLAVACCGVFSGLGGLPFNGRNVHGYTKSPRHFRQLRSWHHGASMGAGVVCWRFVGVFMGHASVHGELKFIEGLPDFTLQVLCMCMCGTQRTLA